MTLYHLTHCGVIAPDLTEDEKTAVLCRWLLRTVPNAAASLRHMKVLNDAGQFSRKKLKNTDFLLKNPHFLLKND